MDLPNSFCFNRDVYPLIVPSLMKILSETKSLKEISEQLNVNIDQAATWVERLSKEENIDKYSIPEDSNLVVQEKLF
jgi:DNA-binding MarR family transcriptional regulator